jgi:mannose-6-phosphate isomerase-like protein (cupin superfamily)
MAQERFWLLNTLVTMLTSHSQGNDGISVLHHRVPAGDSPPLHLHQREDEVFYVLTGEFRFQLGDEQLRRSPGATVLVPKGAVHSYRAESTEGGEFVTITTGEDFERFIRTMGRPTEKNELPPAATPLPSAIETLVATARAHHIEIVGPPLS